MEVLNLFSAEAQFQTEFLPNLLHLFALPPVIVYRHLRSHDLHTGDTEARYSCRTEGIRQDSGPLFASLGLPLAKPSLRYRHCCRGHRSVQSGGGPFVYLSMGWNDRAKLLERAQL